MIFNFFLHKSYSLSLTYTGRDQQLSNIQGTYEFELWGSQGGGGFDDGMQGFGGKGAYVYGKIHFHTKTTLTVKVGGQWTSSERAPNPGGWPNCGKGGEDTGTIFEADYDVSGGGGGSTSFLVGITQLLVAGGSAGSVMTATGCEWGRFDEIFCSAQDDGTYCTAVSYTEGNSNGYCGNGTDSSNIPSSGGGGGYYGGKSPSESAVINPGVLMACSGSSYYNPNYFEADSVNYKNNEREGNGYFEYSFLSSCTSNCQNCPTTETCSLCNSNYFLYEDRYFSQCPIGTYPSSLNFCLSCSHGCSSCTNAYPCTACSNGYYLYEGRCLTSCPTGTFANGATKKCDSCSSDCSSFSDEFTCLSCLNDYNLYNYQCYKDCPSGTNQLDNDHCDSCSSNCMQCSSLTKCDKCTS